MSTNKTFNKVQLDVKFTQATTRANLISEENISISFGKISKYFADLHSQAFTGYTHPTYTARTGKPTGNQTPGFGSTFTISQITSDGTGHVTAATDRTVKIPDTTMGAASADAAGSKGLVPAPAAGKQTSFLRGDGTWAVPTNTNTTYTIATGDSNGQIKVTPSSGSAYNVSVKGLGSAAYTASTSYVPINGKAPNGIGRDGYVAYAHDGFLNYGAGTVTGALVITTPFTKTKGGVMLKFTVDIYNYKSNTSVEYKISGYAYNDGKWYNCTAYCVSSGVYSTDNIDNLTVRFGYVADGFYQVQIGETTTDKWQYPRINIHDISIAYNRTNYTDANTGWSLEFVTSGNIPNITQTITNTAQQITPISVTSSTLDTTPGTFAFFGSGAPWTGSDWCGLQVGFQDDRFQIVASNGTLAVRQNDSSGTPTTTGWSGWKTLSTTDHTHSNYLGAKSDGTYYGMASPTGADNVWIRTTSQGILPYQAGNAGSGHNYLGTSTWYFAHAYIDTVHALKYHGWYGQKTNDTRQSTANITCTGKGAMQIIIVSSALTAGRPAADGYIMDFDWDNTGQYKSQLYIPNTATTNNGIQWRAQSNSSDWSAAACAWRSVLDNSNYKSYTVTKTGDGASGSWGIDITGTANRATYLDVVASNEIRFYNDNQFKANNQFWIGFSWADGSHYTPSGGSDTSSKTAPNITKFLMGNCSAGGLASVHAKTFILGNGSSPTHTSKTTTITTAATTTDRTITLPDASGTIAVFPAARTSGQVVVTDGTAGGIKSSGYTIAASVPSGAVFTDAKVTQTAVGSTYTNYRPIVISSANSATEGFSPSTTTDGTFITSSLYCQPSTGMLHANIFKAGKASTTDGEIKFYRSGSGNSGEITLKATAQSTSGTYLLPSCGNGTYTLSIGMMQVGGTGDSLVMSNVSGIPAGTLSFKIIFKSNATSPMYSMVEIPYIGDGVDCGGLIQVGDYSDGTQGSPRIVMKGVVIRVTAGSKSGTKTFTATVTPTQKISGSSVSEYTRNVIMYKIYACT